MATLAHTLEVGRVQPIAPVIDWDDVVHLVGAAVAHHAKRIARQFVPAQLLPNAIVATLAGRHRPRLFVSPGRRCVSMYGAFGNHG